MKHSRGPTLGALLVIVLCISTWRSVWAMGQRYDRADQHSPIAAPDSFASPNPCSATFHEQEIPDDGSWLQVCLTDPNAPDQSTITEVHVKYLLDHPDPNQLEIRLTRADASISQTLWNRGNAVKEARLGEAGILDAFNGTPSQGEWQLLVRDVVPGQKGLLKAVSVRAYYAPVGPLPQMLSGTPGRPTSFRIPAGATRSSTPDADEQKSAETASAALLQVNGWQDVKRETFEGVFPNAGWTLLDANPNDGKEYLWDDDDFRPHSGGWAAWPANGGTNGLDPASSAYPPNMNSWMIYGPFDLSDAKTAETVFWLWRQIETTYDSIFFGFSSDGSRFTGYQWDGTTGWEEKRYSLNSYLGDSSVWVGWCFTSDSIVQYAGPWVDDMLIRKYVPGQIIARGSFFYADRNNNTVPARFTKVYLYDQDPGGTDDPLTTMTTDINGLFQFPARTNWDDDDPDPDPNNRRLDLYVVWETDTNDSATARRRVTNVGNQAYRYYSAIQANAQDGTADFFNYWIPPGDNQQGAMWIFQDLRRAWEYVRNNTNPQTDPGSVTARWETGRNDLTPCGGSCFYAGPGGPYIFIAHNNRLSSDTVVHETGHHYMYNATGWWLWWDIPCYNHNLFSQEDVNCAWSEGWADFFPLVTNGDSCYDFGLGPCTGIPDWDHYNLETHNRNDNQAQFPFGDIVEGRVAGALYDLWDSTNEPTYDSATFGFDPIADMVFQAPHEDTFRKFWDSWKTSGQNRHQAVRAIYQNTIDYDTAPRFEPPLPDRVALQNLTMPHVIDLWDYSIDDESTDAELGWQIINVTDARCGVSLDSHFVNFAPQQGWLGLCDVTVSVSDSIKANTDTFRVTVVPVRGRSFLPIILK